MIRSFQNGYTQLITTGVFQLNCDFDVTRFPFDRQLCAFFIESEGYILEMQKLMAGGLFFEAFVISEQWNVIYGYSTEKNFTYPSGRSNSIVEFGFYMERKALFYGIAMILPFMASSIVELSTFALAIDDSNRLQLSFTCFLSFTFFISMLTEKLPQNSENMPFLLIAVSITAGSVCLVTAFQAIAFHLATSNPEYLTKEKRLLASKIIDYFAITFYYIVILVIQIIIPAYYYLT